MRSISRRNCRLNSSISKVTSLLSVGSMPGIRAESNLLVELAAVICLGSPTLEVRRRCPSPRWEIGNGSEFLRFSADAASFIVGYWQVLFLR